MAKCTNKTFLMYKATAEATTFTKLVDITEYPDLGGATNKLDATTLSDTKKRNINGIEDSAELEFKALYEKADYTKLAALETAGTSNKYQIWFGDAGIDGIWEWDGKIHVYPTSGKSDAVREMSFTITDEGETALHPVTA